MSRGGGGGSGRWGGGAQTAGSESWDEWGRAADAGGRCVYVGGGHDGGRGRGAGATAAAGDGRGRVLEEKRVKSVFFCFRAA